MENMRITSFNLLRLTTESILEGLPGDKKEVIRKVSQLFKGIRVISDEELECIETVDGLWGFLVEKNVISMDDVQVLKTVARLVKSEELEKAVEEYKSEYESSSAFQKVGYLGTCFEAVKGGTKQAVIILKAVFKTAAITGTAAAIIKWFPNDPEVLRTLLSNILPYGMDLIGLRKGSLYFELQTSSLSSLQQLWTNYKDGSLKQKLKKVINEIDEVRNLTQGTEIDVTVEIDEEEYHEACWVLVLAKSQEVQAHTRSVEKRRRHSWSCDQHLPCADKTQLDWAERIRLKNKVELGKKQIDNLRQEVNKVKEEGSKKEKRLRKTIAKNAAELKLVKKVNEELKDQCFKALSLNKSLQILKIVKDACLDLKNYQVLRENIVEGMEQGDEDVKKVVFESIGKYHMAIQYFDQCLDAILKENEAQEISVYGNLGNVFHSLSSYDNAMRCYKMALELAEKSENKTEEMKAHRNLGILHGKLRQFKEAIQHHKKQLQVAKEFGDEMDEGTAYENLGVVYSKDQGYEEALKYYEKFLKIARNNQALMRGYRNLGDACKQLGKYNDAILNYEEYLKYAEERKDKMKALASLGESYEYLENYDKVVLYYSKFIKIQVADDMNGKANAYESLGNAYRKLHEYNDALKAFGKCLSIAEEIDDNGIKANVYGSMKKIYEHLGKTKEATNCENQRRKLEEEFC